MSVHPHDAFRSLGLYVDAWSWWYAGTMLRLFRHSREATQTTLALHDLRVMHCILQQEHKPMECLGLPTREEWGWEDQGLGYCQAYCSHVLWYTGAGYQWRSGQVGRLWKSVGQIIIEHHCFWIKLVYMWMRQNSIAWWKANVQSPSRHNEQKWFRKVHQFVNPSPKNVSLSNIVKRDFQEVQMSCPRHQLTAVEIVPRNDFGAAIFVWKFNNSQQRLGNDDRNLPLLVGQSAGSSQHLMQARGPEGSTICSKRQLWTTHKINGK